MTSCLACELVARRDRGEAPLWDSIYRTPSWDVAHAYDSSIEGWMVLILRRHVPALTEMTDGEAAELGPLVKAVSAALTTVTGCEKTYMVQFAESPRHRHVHVHVIPRASGLAEDRRGPRVFQELGVGEDRRPSPERLDEIGRLIRAALETAQ